MGTKKTNIHKTGVVAKRNETETERERIKMWGSTGVAHLGSMYY